MCLDLMNQRLLPETLYLEWMVQNLFCRRGKYSEFNGSGSDDNLASGMQGPAIVAALL